MAKKTESQVEETQVEEAEIVEPAAEKPAKKQAKKAAAPVDMSKVDAKQLQAMREELFQHRLNVMLGKESDTAALKTMRKNIARATMYLNMNTQK